MAEGTWGATTLWARSDLRRRWRSLVALGVLAGLTAGLAMAAIAGARRTDTALERLRSATNAADAIVFSSQVGAYHPDWGPLRARPEVEAVAVWDLLFGALEEEPFAVLFASHDGEYLGEVGRPVVVEGRMYEPSAPNEVVVAEPLADEAPVGTTFAFRAFTPDQGAEPGEVPRGPEVTMKVVGVVRSVNQFLFTEQILVSPGFRARYAEQALLVENADVRLANGSGDIAALQRAVNESVAPGAPVLDLHAVSRRVDTTLSVEHTALLLLGLVVIGAGGLLVSQAVVRSAGVVGEDALVLRAVGLVRRDVAVAAVIGHLLTAVVATIAAATTGLVASQFFPVGLGRRIDPDVGIHADWPVFLAGAAAIGVLTVVCVLAVAWRVSGLVVRARAPRPSTLAAAARRRAPVSVGVGVAMALEPGRGRSRVPVRPALLGAVFGVVGVVATLTIDYGINDSLDHPERAGVTWDATVRLDPGTSTPNGFSGAAIDQVLASSPPGSATAVIDRQVLAVNGVGVPTVALRMARGDDPVTLAVTDGRAPRGLGEAMIGAETARVLDAGLGDTVSFDEGKGVRVVGVGLFPTDVHAEFDEGLWVSPEQLEMVSPSPADEADFDGDRFLALRFPSEVDADAEIARMASEAGPLLSDISTVEIPVELKNLRNVRTLPVLLAAFLALLAVAAVGHVLVTSAHRRRHDFAVLRALGSNRRGARVTLGSQGTTVGLVGLVVGVPLGVAVGRSGWHWVAQQVPLQTVPPLALVATLVLIPSTIAVVVALSIWPGHRAAQHRPADVLRAE